MSEEFLVDGEGEQRGGEGVGQELDRLCVVDNLVPRVNHTAAYRVGHIVEFKGTGHFFEPLAICSVHGNEHS